MSVEASARATGKAILNQLFEKRIGNIELLRILRDSYARSEQAITDEQYDKIVWEAVSSALRAVLPGARDLVVVVDGIDEASCGEDAMFHLLAEATAAANNVRLITLGRKKHATVEGCTGIQVDADLIFDEIMAVVRRDLDANIVFSQMSGFDQGSTITRLTEASDGSFLWARLATKMLCGETNLGGFRRVLHKIVEEKIPDFVLQVLQSPSVEDDAKLMLAWLTIGERPLSLKSCGL
jgi:hypothetical protein